MKKTFSFIDPKKKLERVADQVRSDIKKYIKRERKKELPDNMDFWDFDCKYGTELATAEVVHLNKLGEKISDSLKAKADSVYIEILAKPMRRNKETKA